MRCARSRSSWMIDCPNGEIRDRLPDFVHEQLDRVTGATVAAHLASCSACTAEVALLRALRASFRETPAVDVARIVATLPRPRGVPAAGPGPRPIWSRLDWRVAAVI